jgi:hypothetical protein
MATQIADRGVVTMPTDSEIVKTIYDIRERIVKMETKLESNINATSKYDSVFLTINDRLMETDRMARDAHTRACENDKKIDKTNDSIKEVKGTIKWGIGLFLTQLGLLLTIIGLFWRG